MSRLAETNDIIDGVKDYARNIAVFMKLCDMFSPPLPLAQARRLEI